MATKKDWATSPVDPASFEVVLQKVIATIVPTEDGPPLYATPWQAAFLAIASESSPGTFSFQAPGEPRITVTVAFDE